MDKPVPAPPASELQFFTTTPDLSFEDALAHASSVLRCAAVAAQTAGINWKGLHARWCCRSCIWWTWPV